MTTDPATVESGTEYDISNLLHRARLLTSDTNFLLQEGVSIDTLLNMNQAPPCDANSGAFVDLLAALRGNPTSYVGTDPIGDIMATLRQLASCQRAKSSILAKIGNFFRRLDGGKALRLELLLVTVVIDCLCLWYVMKRNNLLGSDLSAMQNLCKQALDAHGFANVDEGSIPSSISMQVKKARQWNNDLSSVTETFRVGTIDPAPVLLVFNPQALNTVMQADQSGSLPVQVQQDTSGTYGTEGGVVPMIFLHPEQVNPMVGQVLGSGQVKQAVMV